MQKKTYKFLSYQHTVFTEDEIKQRSEEFYQWMNQRRTIRDFSDKPISKEVIDNILMAASTAPSGANKQPWTFCLISDSEIKKQIRIAAEAEEKESYENRMPEEWLEDLEPLGTDWRKPFLETAPYLIIIFKRIYELKDGKKRNNYYVSESVGLAAGILISAIHNAGLCSLTHTPSPMNFLSKILQRPENERPFLLLPIGYPADNATVPDIHRKKIEDILVKY